MRGLSGRNLRYMASLASRWPGGIGQHAAAQLPGNGRAQRAFFEQLASDAGFILDWQHLDADRNIAASAAIMRGDQALMRKMPDELVRDP
jgi:hypothetical protein